MIHKILVGHDFPNWFTLLAVAGIWVIDWLNDVSRYLDRKIAELEIEKQELMK